MNKKDFSNFIKEKRSELDLTQEQLAEKLCVSRKVVSSLESGMRYPDVETVQLLAEVLQVTPTELFEKCSVNDKKYAINPAFIIAPIIIMIAILGVVVSLSLRDSIIVPAENKESYMSYEESVKDAEKFKFLSACFDSDIDEAQFTYMLNNNRLMEYEITDKSVKETIFTRIQELYEGTVVENYSDSYCDYEINCLLRKPERAIINIKINTRAEVVVINTYDGSATAYKYDKEIIKPIIEGIKEFEIRRVAEEMKKEMEAVKEKAEQQLK